MRGFWFTIEAVIAGVMLVSFLAFIVTTNIAVPKEELSTLAYKTLYGLNRQGLLKEHAIAGDYDAIDRHVSIYAYSHSVEICTLQACEGTKPSGSNVWVGSYIIPGSSTYSPREVKLYIYR